MCPDDGGVDLHQPVDVAGRVRAGLDLPQGSGEHAVDRVATKPRVDRLPGAIAFWQVTPGDPGTDLVDHPVDDLPVLRSGLSPDGPRYQRSEQLPLAISEFMSAYHETMIHSRTIF